MSQVICVGELLIDFVAKHHSAAIESAENFTKKAGGAPANVACAVQRLGQKALFAGAVGNDPMGNFLVHTLEAERHRCFVHATNQSIYYACLCSLIR